jgi:hypothetical protein
MIATGLVRALEQDLGRLRNAAVAFDIAVESDMGLKTRDTLYRNTILSLSHLFITAGVAVGAAVHSDEVDEIYAVLMDKAKNELSRLRSRGTA